MTNELHIMHSWGGGVARWVSDFCATSKANSYQLKSLGMGWQNGRYITLSGPGWEDRVKNSPNIRTFSSQHSGYRKQIQKWHETIGFSQIYISSLIGHDLSLFDLGVPITYVIHDFFPFCTTLDALRNGPCLSCNESNFKSCRKDQPEQHKFGPLPFNWFLDLNRFRLALLRDHVRLVAPSRFAAELWPKMSGIEKEVSIISHGISVGKTHLFGNSYEKPRVLILGALSESKGLGIYQRLLSELYNQVDFYLLGCGSHAKSLFKWAKEVRPHYELSELSSILLEWKPTCSLQLSPRAETFGYVVAELKAFCIPSIIPRNHAYGDLIAHEQTGLEIDLSLEPGQLLEILKNKDWQSMSNLLSKEEPKSLEKMVTDYLAIKHVPGEITPHDPCDLPSQNFLANGMDLVAGILWKKNAKWLAQQLSRLSQLFGFKLKG